MLVGSDTYIRWLIILLPSYEFILPISRLHRANHLVLLVDVGYYIQRVFTSYKEDRVQVQGGSGSYVLQDDIILIISRTCFESTREARRRGRWVGGAGGPPIGGLVPLHHNYNTLQETMLTTFTY